MNYEVETQGKRRKTSFITHVSKIKPFRDRNELYVDPGDEDGEGWIPTARKKDELTRRSTSTHPADTSNSDPGGAMLTERRDESPTPQGDESAPVERRGNGTPGRSGAPDNAVSHGYTEHMEDPEDQDSETSEVPTLRRSTRANKGVPPSRFGYTGD